jgi:membrane associated rhomboid family serine protease
MKHTIREELTGVLIIIGAIWLVFMIDAVLPTDLAAWGLVPRTLSGSFGIVTMPFLHGSFSHLTGNTVPLIMLLCLLAGSRANSAGSVIAIWLLGGILLWSFGREAIHVGASGLVYGLVSFLIVAGILERRFLSMAVAVIVGLLYGGSLLWGILPTAGKSVSWDGHLAGAIAGALVAAIQFKRRS